MKKQLVSLLTAALLLVCMVCPAAAQEPGNPYELFAALLSGRSVTLTVTAADAELPEGLSLPADEMVMTAVQDENQIVLEIACGEYTLRVCLTPDGAALDGVCSGNYSWDLLAPVISLKADAGSLKVQMTGPEQELIRFSVNMTGAEPDCYAVSFQAGLITGPGAVYGVYDDFSVEGGESARSFAFTWDESMLSLEAEGTETAETAADGTLTLTRTDACTVLLDDEEIGTLTLISRMTISAV